MASRPAGTRLDPHESLGFHCSLTRKAFVSALGAKLEGTDISPAQYMALAHLVAVGPLAQSELADRLSIMPATAVRLVDRMVRDGWATRQGDPADGRVKRVVLTEKAGEVWERASRAGREVLTRAYRGVHPEELETVKRVLEKVRRNLGA
jgi:MarR family transcriptional regulator for hemolysin